MTSVKYKLRSGEILLERLDDSLKSLVLRLLSICFCFSFRYDISTIDVFDAVLFRIFDIVVLNEFWKLEICLPNAACVLE